MEEKKQLDLEVLLGKKTEQEIEEGLEKADLGFVSAFDYYYPVKNFLYGVGIKDSERFEEIVDEGVEIISTQPIRERAVKYLESWVQLIQDIKAGREVKPYHSNFGPITLKYDREKLEGKYKNSFERSVRTLCALAEYNPNETLRRMLE